MSPKNRHRSFRPVALALFAASFLVLIADVFYAASPGQSGSTPTPLPTSRDQVRDFALLDQDGRHHQLYRYGVSSRAIVLFAYDTGCHTVGPSIQALKVLRESYTKRKVSFLLINANSQDGRKVLQQETTRIGIDMPILIDESQLVVESLGIRRTGEALVIDTKTWRIAYRGPIIDEQMRLDMPKAEGQQHYLKDAIEAVLSSRQVANNPPSPAGCPITMAMKENASYTKDVVPILTEKCVPCHQAGGIAPWAMDRYETVSGWSAMMRDAIMVRRMPPWHTDPAHGSFSNDRSLSITQTRKLIHWIDAGSPHGDGPDPLAMAKPVTLPEWPLGKPDLVIDVPPQSIPAKGVVDYRYINIPLKLDRDVWVRAVDLRPSNSAVMHHAFAFVTYPPALRTHQPDWGGADEGWGLNGFAAVYAPGFHVEPLPHNTGQLLPKGSSLLFQMHYNSVGYATTDTPRLALYFHKRPPARELVIESARNTGFRIPANIQDYPVEARYLFKKDALLHGMLPHMHLRGSRISYEAHYQNGQREMLLSIPRYYFNWQSFYLLHQPKPMPAGTVILVQAAFDNSHLNPANPDPSKEVIFGNQSWEEMFIGFLLYSVPRTAATRLAIVP
jgi:peroxiredoxin